MACVVIGGTDLAATTGDTYARSFHWSSLGRSSDRFVEEDSLIPVLTTTFDFVRGLARNRSFEILRYMKSKLQN